MVVSTADPPPPVLGNTGRLVRVPLSEALALIEEKREAEIPENVRRKRDRRRERNTERRTGQDVTTKEE